MIPWCSHLYVASGTFPAAFCLQDWTPADALRGNGCECFQLVVASLWWNCGCLGVRVILFELAQTSEFGKGIVLVPRHRSNLLRLLRPVQNPVALGSLYLQVSFNHCIIYLCSKHHVRNVQTVDLSAHTKSATINQMSNAKRANAFLDRLVTAFIWQPSAWWFWPLVR